MGNYQYQILRNYMVRINIDKIIKITFFILNFDLDIKLMALNSLSSWGINPSCACAKYENKRSSTYLVSPFHHLDGSAASGFDMKLLYPQIVCIKGR